MNIDLTEGNAKNQILRVALPVVGTSFITMLYNFIDIFWVKEIGSEAVASIGLASILIWLFIEVSRIFEIGTQVNVSTAIGEKDEKKAIHFAKTGFIVSISVSLFILLFTIFFSKTYLSIYNITPKVLQYAIDYLRAMSIGIPFIFLQSVMTGIFHAKGNTSTTFKIKTTSVILNIILDPLFIFVLDLGVFGAGLATSISHIVGGLLFLYNWKFAFKSKSMFFDVTYLTKIVKVGFPNFIYMSLFTFTSMYVSSVVSTFGTEAMAVAQVGTQLEAISWMTAGGLSVAVSSFIGQNMGAKNYERAIRGYHITFVYALVLGTVNMFIFFFFGTEIISLFLLEEKAVSLGSEFMRINSISQIFMCIEIVAIGTFLGLSKPLYSSIISAIFTVGRIPLVMYLASPNTLGLNGVWWTIVISCVFKGVLLNLLFIFVEKQKVKNLTSA